MQHQFEPQIEQQTPLYVPPETTSPSVSTPASSASVQQNEAEIRMASLSATTQAQEQTLGVAVSENWQALLEEWKQERNRGWRRYLPLLNLVIAVTGIPLYLLKGQTTPGNQMTDSFILLFIWLYFWVLLFIFQVSTPPALSKRQAAILDALADVEDIEAVGPLLIVWQETGRGQAREKLSAILTRLLLRLHREEETRFTPQQRRILYDNISHATAARHPALALACLDAVEQIGDVHALPPLARLIAHDAPTQQGQKLRERARQCLAHLNQTLNFGTKETIPDWIAKLPYGSATANTPTLPADEDAALIALFALIRLLPQLQPADAELLKASQREYLTEAWPWMNYALGSVPGGSQSLQLSRLGTAFPYAVLDALEQIGTGRDLKLTRLLLNDVPMDELPLLRSRARSVEAVLKQRRDKEQAGYTLLRGASAPSVAPAELLRPATSAPLNSDPKELLRPEDGREVDK